MQVMKKAFIDFNGIKSGISKKSFGIYKRMFVKKSFKTGIRALESARDLSSSGESDFLSMTISG